MGILFPELEETENEKVNKMFLREKSTYESEYRRKIRQFENIHLLADIPREGHFQMPKAQPVNVNEFPQFYIPYSNLRKGMPVHIGVHFFIHDFLFGNVWNNLKKVLLELKKYDLVISTDDSVFMDTPLFDNMRVVFKNRAFTAVGQKLGVNVIPCFSCGDPKYIEYYCDGLPEGGCIAVSAMGTNRKRSVTKIFKYCVHEMCERKHPETLLVYGSNADLGLNIPVIHIPTFVEDLRKRGGVK
jgi:hypothetical protein